ncbi:MAG: type VI secretion system accessory protein TagJ [Gammaproteobacteria bacterium]
MGRRVGSNKNLKRLIDEPTQGEIVLMDNAVKQALHTGDLEQAIRLAAQAVRTNPTCVAERALYATLWCVKGDLLRADQQLHVLLNQDPNLGVTIQPWRELLVAARHRNDVFMGTAAPALAHAATPAIETALQRLLLLREKLLPDKRDTKPCILETDQYTNITDEKTVSEPALIPIRVAKQDPSKPENEWVWRDIDWQDLDDRFAGIIELLSTNGQYYWVDMCQVERLSIIPPTTFLDQLWLPVELSVRNGPSGRLYLPLVYPGMPGLTVSEYESVYTLGQRTDWLSLNDEGREMITTETEEAEQAVWLSIGRGRRTWFIDESICDVSDLADCSLCGC